MLYLLYNEKIEEYSTFMLALFNLFNSYSIITKYFDLPIINQSLTVSEIHFLYNLAIYICMVIIGFVTICTMVQTFRESANLEKKTEDDEVLNKIVEIEESLEKLSKRKKENSLTNLNNIKQIIWLGFEGPSDIYNEKLYLISQGKKEKNYEDNKMLLFNNSRQIISFFKYLFAIKPKLQFKNLEDKFAIVIECTGEQENHELNFQVKETELSQINDLFDWLSFAGCKIPVSVYTPGRLNKNTRMIIINSFNYVTFIDNKFDLNFFLKINIDDSPPTKSREKRRHFSDIHADNHTNLNLKLDKNKDEILNAKEFEGNKILAKRQTINFVNFSQNSKNFPLNQINPKPILKNIENNSLKKQHKLNNSNQDENSYNDLVIE